MNFKIIFFLFSFYLISFGAMQSTQFLVASWQFNEGQGNILFDSSGNSNNGTIYGAIWADGINGTSALQFDGDDDYISISHNECFNIDSFSISAWVCWKGNSVDTTNPYTILRKYQGPGISNRGFYLDIIPPSANINYRLKFDFTVTFGDGGTNMITSDSIIYTYQEKWTHVVAVRDGKAGGYYLHLYVNGIKQVDTEWNTGPLNNTDSLYMGKNFNGKIDNINFYNIPLTQSQVIDLYNGNPIGINKLSYPSLKDNSNKCFKHDQKFLLLKSLNGSIPQHINCFDLKGKKINNTSYKPSSLLILRNQ